MRDLILFFLQRWNAYYFLGFVIQELEIRLRCFLNVPK